jgi:DNA processing protein
VRGALPPAGIAIVGSRTADEAAARFAYDLARALGVAVISGLAAGIDAAAHRGALAAGLATLAYVGTGIDRTFPVAHRELAGRIVAAGGGIATELPPGTEASTQALRLRDRLQAAHASAVVLIATEAAGGAMHTLAYARELGRPRFALVPRGPADDGNARAIEDGAIALPWDLATACRMARP